jgi:hypothetical protein
MRRSEMSILAVEGTLEGQACSNMSLDYECEYVF